jgi:tRNA nucleotidyltransferase (CCA-adding enzyme)
VIEEGTFLLTIEEVKQLLYEYKYGEAVIEDVELWNYRVKMVNQKVIDRNKVKEKKWREFATINGVSERSVENIQIYKVGGAVRDEVMGLDPKDVDYLVTGLTEREFKLIFPLAKKVGANFPVFLLPVDGDKETEFALARKEWKTGVGYNGFATISDPRIDVKGDLLRRDITINAIAKNMETGETVDPFGGVKDIEEKIIRATSDAFKEDPLRVYRAARFAARYGFTIDESTKDMMKELKGELKHLPGERVFIEIMKTIKEGKPSIFFEELMGLELLDVHFIEFVYLKQNKPREYEILLKKLDLMKSKKGKIKLAMLFDGFTEEEIKEMCERYKVDAETRELALFIHRYHHTVEDLDSISDRELLDFLEAIIKSPFTKQGESLGVDDTKGWFVDAMKDFCTSLKKDIKIIATIQKVKSWCDELEKVKLSEEDLLQYKGKERGSRLKEKKMTVLHQLKEKKKKIENDLTY